jgi:inhibitor of KinA sporulation pathway (predicted exonuclease)
MTEILANGPKIILDVEATCWETLPPDRSNWVTRRSEVIEIGVYVPMSIPADQRARSFMIRPVLNPVLSDFCVKLTSITQQMVADADAFSDVMRRLDAWCGATLGTPLAETAWGSWGFYDLNILVANADWLGAGCPRFRDDAHLNIKEMARRVRKDEDGALSLVPDTKVGKFAVAEGLRFFGLGAFQGTQHRGIDDAINIGRIWDTIAPLFSVEDFKRHAGHSRSIVEAFKRKNLVSQ